MESKNHPIGKENYLPNLHWWVSCEFSRVYTSSSKSVGPPSHFSPSPISRPCQKTWRFPLLHKSPPWIPQERWPRRGNQKRWYQPEIWGYPTGQENHIPRSIKRDMVHQKNGIIWWSITVGYENRSLSINCPLTVGRLSGLVSLRFGKMEQTNGFINSLSVLNSKTLSQDWDTLLKWDPSRPWRRSSQSSLNIHCYLTHWKIRQWGTMTHWGTYTEVRRVSTSSHAGWTGNIPLWYWYCRSWWVPSSQKLFPTAAASFLRSSVSKASYRRHKQMELEFHWRQTRCLGKYW